MAQPLSLALEKRYSRLLWHLRALTKRMATGERPRRVVFMHIPKTAGSSVSLFMKTHFGSHRSGRVVYLSEMHDGGASPDRIAAACKAQFVGGHFGWETLEKVRGDAFVFTFLRDPVDRLRSAYWHWRGQADVGAEVARRFPTFRAFLESADADVARSTHDLMARQIAVGLHPAAAAGHNVEGLAAAAIRNLARFDYVGLTERFEVDFARIAVEAGLPPPRSVPRRNVSASSEMEAGERALAEARVPADRMLYDHARQHLVDGRLAVPAQDHTKVR